MPDLKPEQPQINPFSSSEEHTPSRSSYLPPDFNPLRQFGRGISLNISTSNPNQPPKLQHVNVRLSPFASRQSVDLLQNYRNQISRQIEENESRLTQLLGSGQAQARTIGLSASVLQSDDALLRPGGLPRKTQAKIREEYENLIIARRDKEWLENLIGNVQKPPVHLESPQAPSINRPIVLRGKTPHLLNLHLEPDPAQQTTERVSLDKMGLRQPVSQPMPSSLIYDATRTVFGEGRWGNLVLQLNRPEEKPDLSSGLRSRFSIPGARLAVVPWLNDIEHRRQKNAQELEALSKQIEHFNQQISRQKTLQKNIDRLNANLSTLDRIRPQIEAKSKETSGGQDALLTVWQNQREKIQQQLHEQQKQIQTIHLQNIQEQLNHAQERLIVARRDQTWLDACQQALLTNRIDEQTTPTRLIEAVSEKLPPELLDVAQDIVLNVEPVVEAEIESLPPDVPPPSVPPPPSSSSSYGENDETIITLNIPGLENEPLTPELIRKEILPFVQAITDLQHLIDEIEDRTPTQVILQDLKKINPVTATLAGVAQATVIAQDMLVKWRVEYQKEKAKQEIISLKLDNALKKQQLIEAEIRNQMLMKQAEFELEAKKLELEKTKAEIINLKAEDKQYRRQERLKVIEIAIAFIDSKAKPEWSEAERIDYIIRALKIFSAILVQSEAIELLETKSTQAAS